MKTPKHVKKPLTDQGCRRTRPSSSPIADHAVRRLLLLG